jgi:predicted RNase H-like HicB family nuclease
VGFPAYHANFRASSQEQSVPLSINSSESADGTWQANVPAIPLMQANGATQAEAVSRAKALALRALAERIERGETVPENTEVFEPPNYRLPFDDANGNPKLCDSFVVFLDILGSSADVNVAHANQCGQSELERFCKALSDSRSLLAAGTEWSKQLKVVQAFSDCIILGQPIVPASGHALHHENVLGGILPSVAHYQTNMILGGYFVRGGLSNGPMYLGKHAAYGKALLDAVEIEKSRSKFPRIVLDAQARTLANTHISYYANPTHAPQNCRLLIDEDDELFVDYLSESAVEWSDGMMCEPGRSGIQPDTCPLRISAYGRDVFKRHKAIVEQRLRNFIGSDSVRSKYEWVAAYHEWWCDQLQKARIGVNSIRIGTPLALTFKRRAFQRVASASTFSEQVYGHGRRDGT